MHQKILAAIIFNWRNLISLIKKIIAPRYKDTEMASRELLLNILLFISIIVLFFLGIIQIVYLIYYQPKEPFLLIYIILFLSFLFFLVFLSRRKKIKTASCLLIATYTMPTLYAFIVFGTDWPPALILSLLIITFCGMLVGAGAALVSTIFINIFLIIATYFQSKGLIKVQEYWRQESHQIEDAITYALLLLLMISLVLIFDRQIRQALKKARQSERALKKERDSLEEKVEARTKLIREMESDKINQLYRLAEFGRISSGIFHDLVNPLTAVSLNLEQIQNIGNDKIIDAKESLDQAIIAAHKMEDMIACIKRAINQEQQEICFDLNKEIEMVIKILSYKARQANIKLVLKANDKLNSLGDPVKFSQIITNLICNGIEAYHQNIESSNRCLKIKTMRRGNKAVIKVLDRGCGIPLEYMDKIFQPFFSTKIGKGMGIGLSSTKNIIEKDFSGSIKVANRSEGGAAFTITLPLSTVGV